MQGTPRISVIIPTYNRAKLLTNTVKDLLAQEYPDFEIVIVDQTPNSTIKGIFCDNDKVIYLRLEKPNLTQALNVGWRSSTGSIIVFLDDDIHIEDKGFLINHACNYDEADVGAVAGAIFKPDQKEPSKIPKKFFNSRF